MQVSFPHPRNIFLVVERTSSDLMCLPMHQFYFQMCIFRGQTSNVYINIRRRSKIKHCLHISVVIFQTKQRNSFPGFSVKREFFFEKK